MRRRDRRAAPRAEQTGAYEVRYRLEPSYRARGVIFFLVGLVGFFLTVISGELLLLLLTGAATGAGIWIYWQDPREYLVVQPRRFRLQLLRVYGKQTKVRQDLSTKEFSRLEVARYRHRRRGERMLLVLFDRHGGAVKLDDRGADEELVAIGREVAAAAGLEFLDRGRVDHDASPPRVREVAAMDAADEDLSASV
ncbi:MAG: hypothetical protein IT204_09050 [Fimbriimonadaceae bacterium]|nr:hypothetical protein [Fimbriimonadaceae bacterium]